MTGRRNGSTPTPGTSSACVRFPALVRAIDARPSRLVPELENPSDQQCWMLPGATLRAVAPWLASS